MGSGDDGSDIVKGQADDDSVSGGDQNDKVYGGQGDDNDVSGDDGNDLVKTRDNVSGNDTAAGGIGTDTCVIDAGDTVISCEL